MKTTLPALLTLLLLSAVVLSPVTTNGQELPRTPKLEIDQNDIAAADDDDNDSEDDEPVQRVARITFIEGDVSFLRAGVSEWSDAAENLPLLTGDQIYVGSRGRAEIQFGRGNYVRLSEKTSLTLTELSHTAALLEVTEGVAIIRLERYGSAWERFEVDTPNSALVLKQDGLYRVNVRGKDDSEVIIRRGLAEVFSDDGNFKVREGQRLTIDTSPNGKLQIAIDNSNDEWDRWTYDRDRQADYLAVSSAPDYVRQYETDYNSFYGASDLTNYGSWTSYSGYGNCWVPRVSAGWAPYRSGQWLWIPRAGWTWLSNEPWGWAPYHYGRWVFLNNIGWAWAPGFNNNRYNYGHSYYQWRPALVAFFNCPTPRGNFVGWYPLSPGQRWRRSGNFGGDGFRGNNGHRHLQHPVAGNGTRNGDRRPNGGGNGNGNGFGNSGGRPRVGNGNGVTVLPVEGFAGQGRTKFKPNAPNPELSNSFNKGARPGLPDLGNNTNSYVNTKVAKLGDPSNGTRAVVKPPQEVFNRSVVTRQRTTETPAETVAPRERRFIDTPGSKQSGNEVPNNKRGRRGEDISGSSGNNGSSNTANGNGRVITDESIRKRTKGSGEETIETRKGDASTNSDSSGNWKTRNRTTTVNQPEGEADSSAKKRERANQNNEDSTTPSDANRRVYVPREKTQEETSNVEERRREKQERRQQEQQEQQNQQQQQQQQEQQRREEQERQQRRAERQEQEKQQQQQQEQERQQRRAERQQQEQQQQEQQRREQQQQQEQRRAEKEQQRQQQQQEQQRQQQQQQEQQRQQQQQEQQRREEKQQRKKGDN